MPVFGIFKVLFSFAVAIFLAVSVWIGGITNPPNPPLETTQTSPSFQFSTRGQPPTSSPEEAVAKSLPPEGEELPLGDTSPTTNSRVQTSVSPPPTPPPLPTQSEFAQANNKVRAATVNILCEMRKKRVTQTVTGSGVVIDPRGVILTNAHLAQYFLLKNYPTNNATTCVVRTGSPARSRYLAELLYIPTSWIASHAHEINSEDPSGTGESDYAFVYITKPFDEKDALPSTFSAVSLNLEEEIVEEEEEVLVASYPAIISNSQAILENLYLTSATASVEKLYTFGKNLLDLFSLSGNITAQRGSSGGAVVNREGKLIGLIVTSTVDQLILERNLRALTPAYINRNLQKESGKTIAQFLFGDLNLRVQAFALTTAPILTSLLERELNH